MRRILVAVTAIAAIVFFTGGAVIYKDMKVREAAAAAAAHRERMVRDYSPVIGRKEAPVTVVEFFDPSCEACRAFYPYVKQIMEMTGPDVRLVLRYTALHEGSDEVVGILEAARKQDRFIPVLEAILEKQPEWAIHGAPDTAKAWDIAIAAGLDAAVARDYVKSPDVERVLTQDTADFQAIGVRQTPTFYVNGRPLTDFSPQGLLDLVAEELKERAQPAS